MVYYHRYNGVRKTGRNDPMSNIIVGGIFCLAVFLAIVASPFILVVVGIVFYSSTEERQNKINLFNSKLETWTKESYSEFENWFSSTSLKYTFDNGSPMYEVLGSTSLSSINFQSLSHPEDNPPINTNFTSFYYKTEMDYDDIELEFDTSAMTKIFFIVNGNIENQAPSVKTFKKVSYDCYCVEHCDSDDYCYTSCSTCYRRYYLKSLCYVVNQYGALTECFEGNAAQYTVISGSSTYSDSSFGRKLTINIEFRHEDDPELLLFSVTSGTNDFGLSKSAKIIYGSLFTVFGGFGIAIEVCLCIFIPCIVIVLLILKKKPKILSRLSKRERKLVCLSSYCSPNPKVNKIMEDKEDYSTNTTKEKENDVLVNNNVVYKTQVIGKDSKENQINLSGTQVEPFVPFAEEVLGIDYSSTLDPRENLNPITYPVVDSCFLKTIESPQNQENSSIPIVY